MVLLFLIVYIFIHYLRAFVRDCEMAGLCQKYILISHIEI